jgi:cysteine-rich repeat protein
VTVPPVSTITPTQYSQVTFCGDGVRQPFEQCDDGINNGTDISDCSVTCQIEGISSCGNGTLEKEKGEECDDGNTRNGDGCNRLCKIEVGKCGDRIVQTARGEQCDDANQNNEDDCDNECQYVALSDCGDGVLNPATEQCDFGEEENSYAPNAWCRPNCTWQYCGDGVWDDFIEECDDGNNLDNDGCSAVCIVEHSGAPPLTGDLSSSEPSLVFEQIPTPAKTPTGPGLVIFLASGAAAGIGIARRRFRK